MQNRAAQNLAVPAAEPERKHRRLSEGQRRLASEKFRQCLSEESSHTLMIMGVTALDSAVVKHAANHAYIALTTPSPSRPGYCFCDPTVEVVTGHKGNIISAILRWTSNAVESFKAGQGNRAYTDRKRSGRPVRVQTSSDVLKRIAQEIDSSCFQTLKEAETQSPTFLALRTEAAQHGHSISFQTVRQRMQAQCGVSMTKSRTVENKSHVFTEAERYQRMRFCVRALWEFWQPVPGEPCPMVNSIFFIDQNVLYLQPYSHWITQESTTLLSPY
jgi:hypothetical protein